MKVAHEETSRVYSDSMPPSPPFQSYNQQKAGEENQNSIVLTYLSVLKKEEIMLMKNDELVKGGPG